MVPDAAAFQSFSSMVREYRDVLARKRQQLVYLDDYGIEKVDRWEREIVYFANKVLSARADFEAMYEDFEQIGAPLYYLMQFGDGVVQFSFAQVSTVVDHIAVEGAGFLEVAAVPDALDGPGFERHCLTELERFGWAAKLTRAGADQGVDIVAIRGSTCVAIQCKKYSSPVGNAAIQEVYAGRVYYGAGHTVVVSNADYTPAARRLAAATGTHLLHYSQLAELASLIGKSL